MEIIGFSSIWQCLWHLAPRLKKYQVNSRIYVQEFSQSLTVMESGSLGDVAEANDPPKLHRVFSPSLHPKKSWYALNFALCDCKPSRFCTLGYARVFPNEYRQTSLDDLCSDNGVPASATWFSDSGRRREKVYVASAFGLTVGTLRQKSLADVQFIRSNEFQALVAWVNAFDLNRNEVQPSRSIECLSQKPGPEIIPPSKENLVQGNGNSESLSPTPPITPSPPNSKSARAAILHVPPKPGKKRTLSELRADDDLSPASKKRKICETAVNLMEQMKTVNASFICWLSCVIGPVRPSV